MLKKIVLIFAIVLLSNSAFSQYSLEKKQFDYRTYTPQYDDAYKPVLAGVGSYFIPGLGQFYCREHLRGVAFLGGYLGSAIVTMSGVVLVFTDPNQQLGYDLYTAQMLIYGGIISGLVIQLWSIIDAVQMAKVKNLKIRANNEESSMIFLKPKIFFTNNQNIKTVGLSLNVNF